MSSQLGSIIALWSANGMSVRTSSSQPLSNAPQPPSAFCIESCHAAPRARASRRRPSSSAFGNRTAESAIRTSAVSSQSG